MNAIFYAIIYFCRYQFCYNENKIKCMPSTSNSLGKMQRRHQYHPNVCSHCKYGRKPCLYSQIKTKVLEIKFQREV